MKIFETTFILVVLNRQIPEKHMVQELAKKGYNSELNELETFFATKGVQIAPFEEQKLY